VEGIQQREFSAVFFQEVTIEVGELEFQLKCIEGIVCFVFGFLLGLEEGVEGAHVGVAFWVLEGELYGGAGFELDGAGVVEGGLFDGFAFDADLAEAVGVGSGEGVFADGAVTH
jgi:hypothetical protein